MANKEQPSSAELWEVIKKHSGRPSVAKIKPGPDQLQEIEVRLQSLAADLGAVGVSVSPVAVKIALSLDDQTYERYIQCMAQAKDEKGNNINITLDKSDKSEDEKAYILRRSEIIKNALQMGEALAIIQAQAKDNRENGGSLWIAQNVYGYGQQQGKDQVTFTLEDMLVTYAAIKERQAKAGKT